jgi:hypothetical protein
MKTEKKPTNRYVCGEPRGYGSGLAYLRVVHANDENEALAAYIEDRENAMSPGMSPGDEVQVIPLAADSSSVFVLVAEEEAGSE